MSRLLIFRSGAIGDFILATPVLHALRKYRPEARVTLYCHSRMAALVLAGKLADEVESIDSIGVSRLFVQDADPGKQWQELVQSADEVISLLHDPDGIVRDNLVRAAAKRVICGSPLVGSGHAADWLMRPLAEMGIPVTVPAVPSLRLPEDLVARGREVISNLLPVHGPAGQGCPALPSSLPRHERRGAGKTTGAGNSRVVII
ncbi:MAG: hypothetical protein WCN95_14370, partial [bacterium]